MRVTGIVLHPSTESLLDAFLDSPSHAILLAGPSGTGKSHVATMLAATLLGVVDVASYAYYRVVQPNNGRISIEEIRELISFFRLKVPGSASLKRVAIIIDADTMGTEAQNALLKLLEEPPDDSVLLLTSSQPRRLLTTIQSRLQQLQLPAPQSEALIEHFTAMGYDTAAVNGALLRSGTNVAEAFAILSNSADTAGDTLDLVKKALGGSSYDRLLLADGLSKQKDTAAAFVSTLSTVATASLEAAARKKATSVDRWRSVLQAAHTAEDALERSGNTKLVLTELMLSI